MLLLRARNLAAKDRNGLSDPFVRFQLGKTKAKSATVYKNLNPEWNEEFLFRVEDIENDVLEITLWDEDFLGMADFLGHVSIPVAEVSSAEGQNITRTWYTLTQKGDRPRDYYISGEAAASVVRCEIVSYLVRLHAASVVRLPNLSRGCHGRW